MLTEKSIIDSIDVLADGQIQVRRADLVYRDGVEIAKQYHRHVVHPGMNLDKEDDRVRTVARVVHTQDVIKAYRARILLSAG